MQYRIITNGTEFKVQKRFFFFWWEDVSFEIKVKIYPIGGGESWTSTKTVWEFENEESALEAIDSIDWKTVGVITR